MYYKLYKSNRLHRVQKVKSDARHRWYCLDPDHGWIRILTHKKPAAYDRVMIRFLGNPSRQVVFVGYDHDRNWRGKRFIVEDYSKTKQTRKIQFLKRIGWRKELYGG